MRDLIHFYAANRTRILPIRTHPAIAAKLQRLQGAIMADAYFVILHRRPAAMHADEIFLARKLQPDRRTRQLGQRRRDEVRVLVLILVAEVAAHVLADDA